MTKTVELRISASLPLPLNFATEGVAAVGMRGSGKSNTLRRWAEVLDAAGIPFVAIDPKGDWWGLRSSADGKSEGLSVAVFGGLYATDGLPLDEYLGKSIADLLVDTGMSAVLDVSRLSVGARARFLTEFCERLMDRHQVEPHVRCVILEEAHRYIPQRVPNELARVKEATAAILLEGRAFGLGCWAATQRPARLNKDVLEEVGTAIIHRIGAAATNDLKTIAGWVKHEDLGDEIVPSLTKLKAGEAWVLAPSTLGIAQRVQIDRSRTFDSGATPLVGVGSRPTVKLAEVNTAVIKEALAEAIDRAKENDPAEIRKRLARAEARVKELEMWEPPPPPPPLVIHGVSPALGARLVKARAATVATAGEFVRAMQGICDLVDEAIAERDAAALPVSRPSERVAKPEVRVPEPRQIAERAGLGREIVEQSAPRPERGEGAGGPFTRLAERKVVEALVRLGSPQTVERVAAASGYSPRSKGFTNALSALRTAGLLEQGRPLALTPDGEIVGVDLDVEPIRDVLEHWKANPKIRRAGRLILDELARAWRAGEEPTKAELADRVGYSPRSKGFTNELSMLRSLGLIVKTGDPRLTDEIGGTLA